MTNMQKEDYFLMWLMSLNLSRPWDLINKHSSAEGIYYNEESDKVAPHANRDYMDKLIDSIMPVLDKGAAFISYVNKAYPNRLKTIPDPPLGLFVLGKLPAQKIPAVAVVGSRNYSSYGKSVAEEITRGLCAHDINIISGMAKGTDTIAHEEALRSGGKTYAVLPSGVDVCYPKKNYNLYCEIIEKGGVISEMLPGFTLGRYPEPFHRRNRIVSSLSDILIIVEAGERSGTTITAGHALNQGRDVFAVPGRIGDEKSIGANILIKQGAYLLTGYEDVLTALNIANKDALPKEKSPKKSMPKKDASKNDAPKKDVPKNDAPKDAPKKDMPKQNPIEKLPLATNESLVYASIGHEAVNLDHIIFNTKLSVSAVNSILVQLELDGHVKRLPGQRYIKA